MSFTYKSPSRPDFNIAELYIFFLRLESVELDIEDYSVEERSCFENAVNFLKETLPKMKHLKPFRLSKVTSKTIVSSIIKDV